MVIAMTFRLNNKMYKNSVQRRLSLIKIQPSTFPLKNKLNVSNRRGNEKEASIQSYVIATARVSGLWLG